MSKLHRRTKSLIRERHKAGMSVLEIQASFPVLKLSHKDITDVIKKFNRLEWYTINGQKHLKCNTCWNIKPYTYEYFQITEYSAEKKCRDCRNLARRNKRVLAKNQKDTKKQTFIAKRRWFRIKIMRLVAPDYYSTTSVKLYNKIKLGQEIKNI